MKIHTKSLSFIKKRQQKHAQLVNCYIHELNSASLLLCFGLQTMASLSLSVVNITIDEGLGAGRRIHRGRHVYDTSVLNLHYSISS